jgi:glutamate decarboxylase
LEKQMPLHDRDDVRPSPDADIFGTEAADIAVPKYRMPERGMRPDVAHALVRDELFLDGNARQNLATFCQTWLDPEVHQLMDLSIDKNMIDKDEYPRDGGTGESLRPYSCRSLEFT